MEPVSAVASILAVIEAGIAVIRSFKKLKRWREAPKQILELLDEISGCEAELSQILALLLERKTENIQAQDTLVYNVKKVEAKLIDLRALINNRLTQMTRHGHLKVSRTAWTWNEHLIGDLQLRLSKARSFLSLNLMIFLSDSMSRLEQTNQAHASRQLEMFDKLERKLESISQGLLTNEHATYYGLEFRSSLKHNGTRDDLLTPRRQDLGSNRIRTSESVGLATRRDLKVSKLVAESSLRLKPRYTARSLNELSPAAKPTPCKTLTYFEWLVSFLLIQFNGDSSCWPNEGCSSTRGSPSNMSYVLAFYLCRLAMNLILGVCKPVSPERCLRLENVRPFNSNIFFFARMDFRDRMRMLLVSGQASVLDVEYPENRTALYWSIKYESWDSAELLLSMGLAAATESCGDGDPSDIAGDLILARESGKLTSYPGLTSLAGAAHANYYGFTELHNACAKASINHFCRVLETQIVDQRDTCGRTTLYCAAQYNDVIKVELLLEKGADPNVRSTQNRTPVHAAARAGSLAALEILLRKRYRAEVNAKDRFGCTPLMNAVSKPNGVELANVLIKHGADANIRNTKGWRPVHVLVTYNKTHCLRTMHEAGAELDMVEKEGIPLWSVALQYGANDVLQYLVSCPTLDVDAIFCGRTILHFAAMFGDSKALEVLHSQSLCNLDINARDEDGKSALQVAAWRRDHNVDWLRQVQCFGSCDRGALQLDEDPQAQYLAFEALLGYLDSNRAAIATTIETNSSSTMCFNESILPKFERTEGYMRNKQEKNFSCKRTRMLYEQKGDV